MSKIIKIPNSVCRYIYGNSETMEIIIETIDGGISYKITNSKSDFIRNSTIFHSSFNETLRCFIDTNDKKLTKLLFNE